MAEHCFVSPGPLSTETCSEIAQLFQFLRLIAAFLSIKMNLQSGGQDLCLHRKSCKWCDDNGSHYLQAIKETTNITDPVQETVGLALYSGQASVQTKPA